MRCCKRLQLAETRWHVLRIRAEHHVLGGADLSIVLVRTGFAATRSPFHGTILGGVDQICWPPPSEPGHACWMLSGGEHVDFVRSFWLAEPGFGGHLGTGSPSQVLPGGSYARGCGSAWRRCIAWSHPGSELRPASRRCSKRTLDPIRQGIRWLEFKVQPSWPRWGYVQLQPPLVGMEAPGTVKSGLTQGTAHRGQTFTPHVAPKPVTAFGKGIERIDDISPRD